MKNRIKELFERKKGKILSIFFTAGFPQFECTIPVVQNLENAGVDLIEIGIPFSDPIADGPVIQESNHIALEGGMSVKKLLGQVREIRKTVKLPIILMGYLNPVIRFGFEKFCKEASEAGADGLILPDLPLSEYHLQYKKQVDDQNLKMIFLVSPTTSDSRIREIDKTSDGFIYAVSASSTTGAKEGFTEEQDSYFKRLKELKLTNPYLVGFGISSHDTFEKACRYGAGAIIGSAFITMLKASKDLSGDIKKFIEGIRG